MNFDIKRILKFLFPEWQVIEAVKQDGFIARPDRNIKRNPCACSAR
jgi:hypothetical protein